MNILDIAVVLRGTRHEVWLPTLSDQKSHFWSVFRNNKSFIPDMGTVIWDKVKKIYLTYYSASTAVNSRGLDYKDCGKPRASFPPQTIPSDRKHRDIVNQKLQLVCCV